MENTMKTVILISLLSAFLSGCIENNAGKSNVTAQETQPGTGIGDSRNVVELAKKDAMVRFNLSEEDIKVDAVIPVEWTDTSLGYPEPGKESGKDYEIKTIKGYTIFIIAKDKTYEYHSDYSRIAPPAYPVPDLEDMPMIINKSQDVPGNILDLIKKDLKSKYNVSEQDIIVLRITPVTWPDTSLGNPQPGMSYAQVLTPGYVIVVTDGKKTYEYHTGLNTVILYSQ